MKASPAAPLAVALLPLIYLVGLVIRLHVDVPFGDQWELVPNLDKLNAGTLSFHDVWQLRNEHRPLFPTLVLLGLAWLTNWNITVEIVCILLLGIAIALVCLSTLRSRDHQEPAWRWWAAPLLSLVLFSPAQWENWLWGAQLHVMMSLLFTVIGFRLLAGAGRSSWRFFWAIVCGVFSMYSFGSGLTYWPVGLLALWLNKDQRTPGRFAAWIVVASVLIWTYFIEFYRPPGSLPMLSIASVQGVVTLAEFTCTFLGAAVAGYSETAAVLTGMAGLVLLASLVFVTFALRGTRVFVFAGLLALNAIANAMLTALGRAAFGMPAALASRYQTIAAEFWVAVILLSVLAIRRIATQRRLPRFWVAVPITLACGLCVLLMKNAAFGVIGATARSNFLASVRPHLQAGTNWKAVSHLYLDSEQAVRERAAILQRLGMSVYRAGQEIRGPRNPTNALPMGVIDQPADGAIVQMSTLAGGWAIDDRGIREIRVYVDGYFLTATPLNTPRPDVARAYPGSVRGNDLLGWTTTVVFPSPGRHTLVAQAVDSDGATRDLGTITVHVRN